MTLGAPVVASRLLLLYAFRVGTCIIAASLVACGGKEAVQGSGENPGRDASQPSMDSALAPSDAAAPFDAAVESDQGPVCTLAQCMNLLPFYRPDAGDSFPDVTCCVPSGCIFGGQAAATSCSDPDAEVISASDYDDSCDADSDCVNVAVGNFCYPGANSCPNGAISKKAYPKYQSDISKTYAAQCFGLSGCRAGSIPCCRNGKCQTDPCFSNSDTLPACSDAGGTCEYSITCSAPNIGPGNSCAYADEMCCLP
jgi:hypothetical protein